MTKTYLKLTVLIALITTLTSCQEDVDTQVVLNGMEFGPSVAPPPLTEKGAYYEIISNDVAKIIAADQSEPKDAVSERFWVVKGPDGKKLLEEQDKPAINFTCPQPGWYSVYLEINQQKERAQTCWIYATGEATIEEVESLVFEVLAPKKGELETKESNIELQLHTELFEESELDGIEVRLNGKRITDLALDLTQELTTAQLSLLKGTNQVEIKANIDGELFSEELVIVRLANEPPPPKKPKSQSQGKPKNLVNTTPAKKEPSKKKKTPPPAKEETEDKDKPLSKDGSAAFTDLSAMNRCESSGLTSASITLKAKKRVELETILIHAQNCGRAKVTVITPKDTLSAFGIPINERENSLYLSSILNGYEMEKNEEWTINIILISDSEMNCPEQPEFTNLGQCNPKTANQKHIVLSGPNKDLIGEIQYFY